MKDQFNYDETYEGKCQVNYVGDVKIAELWDKDYWKSLSRDQRIEELKDAIREEIIIDIELTKKENKD